MMESRKADYRSPEAAEVLGSLEGWVDFAFRMRARRKALFGEDLFSDPAWEIILCLGRTGSAIRLEEIAEQIGLSGQTTRRWLALLSDRGHVHQPKANEFALTLAARMTLPKMIP